MSTTKTAPEIDGLKARLKDTWMAGDYDLSLAKIKNTSKISNIRRGCVTCYMDDVQTTRRFGE